MTVAGAEIVAILLAHPRPEGKPRWRIIVFYLNLLVMRAIGGKT